MFVLIVIICVTALDQLSKYMICRYVDPADVVQVVPGFFNIIHVRNTGAAWGAFHGFNGFLVVFSAVMLAGIIAFRKALLGEMPSQRLAMALITAGIIGNLLDRLRLGSVVDFLDFYWRTHHFATFNVADSSICIGVALYVVSTCIGSRGEAARTPDVTGEKQPGPGSAAQAPESK